MRLIIPSLVGVALVLAVLLAVRLERPDSPSPPTGPRLAWVFEAPQPGSVVAAPCVTGDAIYLAATRAGGLRLGGVVYAVDPSTGKTKWSFDAAGAMLPTASTPFLADGRLFVGEGMHADFACRLRCLDSAGGRERWAFSTTDHIEGGPVVFGDTVLVASGNDGLYAVDKNTGNFLWNFRADLHIDSTPCVSDGRVYVGSGKSRRFQTYQVVGLDLQTGNPVWRTPVDLPAWGSPIVVGNRLFIGLGNGRLNEPAQPPETPAGSLACLDTASGKMLWSFRTGDAVFGRPAVVGDRVVFGSRDGNLYVLSLEGQELFRLPMGGAVVAGIATDTGSVYAVSVDGRVVGVDPVNGSELWRHELGGPTAQPQVFAAPVVASGRLYVAAEMVTGGCGIVTLFCFELPGQGDRS